MVSESGDDDKDRLTLVNHEEVNRDKTGDADEINMEVVLKNAYLNERSVTR